MSRAGHRTQSRDLIIVAGQSNAAGYILNLASSWPEYQRDASQSISYCHWVRNPGSGYTRNDVWSAHAPQQISATEGGTKSGEWLGNWTKNIGIEARRIGWRPAIAHFGYGGTSLGGFWTTQANTDELCAWVNARRAELQSPTLRGMIWYQGESDAVDATYSAAWAANMATVASRIRTGLSAATMPIAIVKIPSTWSATYLTTLRAQQSTWAASDAHTSITEDTGGATFVDGTHIDTTSILRIAPLVTRALAVTP